MKHLVKPLLIAAFICSVMHCSPAALQASDHLDAPSLTGNGQQDINDLYAFRPSDTSTNSVLILTVNPFAGTTGTFGTNTAYRFEVDTTGDALSNITYEATFTGTGPVQNYTLTQTDSSGSSILATGVTGISSATTNGGTVQAGIFDDPFFFDLNGFQNGLEFHW